jgi:hypothetical protein
MVQYRSTRRHRRVTQSDYLAVGRALAADMARLDQDHLPRCDCGHLFEICNSPNCANAPEEK